MPEGKFFAIQSQLNDLVLDVKGEGGPGTPVVTWQFKGRNNQLWWQDPIANVIRSRLDENLVLEVKGDELIVNEYQADEYNQKWRVTVNRISHLENDDLVLDVARFNEEPGATVCSWDYKSTENQHWNFLYQEPQYFFIHSKCEKHDEKVMDVSMDKRGQGEGARIIVYKQKTEADKYGTDNQLFYEDKYGIIHSKMNDLVIDTSDDEKAKVYEYDPDVPKRQYVYSPNRIVLKDEPECCLQIKDHDDFKAFKDYTVEEGNYKSRDYQKWWLQYV